MDSLNGLPSGDTKSFTWRAEDAYSHQYHFRRDQTGWMQFDGSELVRGCFSGLIAGEDIDFEGRLVSENAPDVPAFRSEWDKISRMAYGRGKN